jgi:uncharacterized cupredoxin-like copper-binding protein
MYRTTAFRSMVAAAVTGTLLLGAAACGDDSETAIDDEPAAEAEADQPETTEAVDAVPAGTTITVSTDDYTYDGLPQAVEAGTTTFVVDNVSTEQGHEMAIFQNPDGLSFAEVAAGGPAGFEAAFPDGHVILAGPGATSEPTAVELEPGTYEVVCFIPSTEDGLAHFEHGMHTQLEVV